MVSFSKRKRKRRGGIGTTLLLFAAVMVLFLVGIEAFASGSKARQRESLENALTRGITAVYAREGRYPESLASLRESCGLTWNEDLFFVDYQVRGANLRPEFTIIDQESSSFPGV